MSFMRYKTLNGKLYAYEVTSMWDKKLKHPRSTSKYLGPADPNTKEIIPFIKKEKGEEKLILDFGDTYFFISLFLSQIFIWH